MKFQCKWDITAMDSYAKEAEFILLKWNYKEVEKFIILVNFNLERLSENPEIGKFSKELNVFKLVISKQTTLYYSLDMENKIVKLHVFWNNLKNPDDLVKLLHK